MVSNEIVLVFVFIDNNSRLSENKVNKKLNMNKLYPIKNKIF